MTAPTPKPITMGIIKACCALPKNLGPPKAAADHPGHTVRVCRVCGCRHFRMHAEPGRLGMMGR